MAKATSVGSRASKPNHRLSKRGAVVGGRRLTWRRVGDAFALHHGKSKNPLLHVEPDPIWPECPAALKAPLASAEKRRICDYRDASRRAVTHRSW
jgi:hypothetical protein